MRRPASERRFHVGERRRRALAGQADHQIDIDAGKHAHRRGERRARLRPVVDASQPAQGGIVETLHPQREPVHPGGGISREARRFEGAGVRLQRNLGIGRERQVPSNRRHEPRKRFAREQARRAAAKEDRVDRPPARALGLGREVGFHRREEFRLRHLACERMGIEVAVGTLAHAPGHVRVERQRHPRRIERAQASSRASRALSRRKARPRWLRRFFSSGESSAAVLPSAGR